MNVADDDDNDGKDLPMNIPAVKSLEKSLLIRLFPRSLFLNKFNNSGLKSVYHEIISHFFLMTFQGLI